MDPMAFKALLMEFQSGLREYCLGIVTAAKEEGSDIIKVSPIERVTMQNGMLADAKTDYKFTVNNAQGVPTTVDSSGNAVIEATWIPMGDNHLMSSPDVQPSETVMIYRYGDDPRYFWNTQFREPSLRRLEDVVWAVGNLRENNLVPWDMESSYFMRWDTMNDKSIVFVTTQSDGEQYAYEFKIHPGGNKVTLKDNIGNIFELDSPSNNVSLTDASGGRYETRDGHPKITGPKGFLVEAPNSVFSGNVEVKGNTQIRGSLQVNGYAHFPSGHGPH